MVHTGKYENTIKHTNEAMTKAIEMYANEILEETFSFPGSVCLCQNCKIRNSLKWHWFQF